MTHTLNIAQIEQLKRDAKRRARASQIPLHQALDQLAAERNYANWSLLMKHAPAQIAVQASLPSFRFARTAEEMRLATHKVRGKKHAYMNRWELAEDLIDDICGKFTSAANAVDFAIDYMECLLTLPRSVLTSRSKAYWETRYWLPYCLHPIDDNADFGSGPQILVSRHYKPVGMLMADSGAHVPYKNYQHIHTNLTPAQIHSITRTGCQPGFLYNDGCCPWHGKPEARAYVEQLRKVRPLL